jgi:4-amino-4-deoxy-L-arabinose transferase-like glycosyltransferase
MKLEERRLALTLLVTCLLLFSFQIGNHDFWDPDEPRYAGVVRNILEGGDWLRLTDNGRPYTEKPPLYFWAAAVTAKLAGGLSETTARIPAGLAALACVAAVYRLGKSAFGPRAGWLGAMVLATSQRFFLEARWVHLDTLLTLFIVLALEAGWGAIQGSRSGWFWMYLWISLGCMTKGPLALALPILALLVYLASRRELGKFRESGWAWGLLLSVTPALGWLLASAAASGIDPGRVLRRQIVERFQEGVHHPRPFYYYLYSLPLEFLPWTLFLPSTLRFTLPTRSRRDRQGLLFLYAWIVGGIALLSIVAEKRPSYLVPLFPPLALLVGVFLDFYLTRYDPAPILAWVEGPTGVAALSCLLGTLSIPYFARNNAGLGERLLPLGILLFFGCSGALWAQLRGRRGASLLVLIATVSAGYLMIVGTLLPWLNPYKSARPFCQRILAAVDGAPLGIYGDYIPAFSYYTHRNLHVVRNPRELEGLLDGSPSGYCIVPKPSLESLEEGKGVRALDEATVGHRSFLLVGAGAALSPEKPGAQASPR